MDRTQRRLRWWLVVLGVVAAAACGSPKRLHFGSLQLTDRSFQYRPGVEWFSLPNGLTVALVPDDRANLVTVDVRYMVGLADDPLGKAGLAHVVEHMMFEQRTEPGGPTLDDRLTSVALGRNASTSWDATHYREVALAPHLDDLLAIEATRMAVGCHGIDQPTFDRELAVVLEEYAQRGPHDVIDALHREVFGGSHAYARTTNPHDVAALTLADVCSFIDAYYAPSRAILVVGGRIDPRALREPITRRFGPLHRHAKATRTPIQPVVLSGGTSEIRADTDDQAIAMVLFPAAPWSSLDAIDDRLLDGLVQGRLAELHDKERWITGVEVGHVGGMRAGARFFALEVVDPSRLDDAVRQIFRIIDELTREDSASDLATLGAQRQRQLLDGFESVVDRGEWCANYLQFSNHREFHLDELKELQEIDVERIHARARRLVPQASRVVHVLPAKGQGHAARAQLQAREAKIDLPVWRAPVDPAEADRPIVLAADRHPSTVSEFHLENGLRVVMVSGFTQPVFEARLVFPVGETSTGANRAVIANAAAELLGHDHQRGYSLGEGLILRWVMRLGARLSAEVNDHTTVFQVRGSSLFADWHIWRLYWLLNDGVYDDDELTRVRERAARAAGRRRHDEGRGWRRAFRESLFGRDHPYAQEAQVLAKMSALDTGDLERFRETYYRAQGATLIVVGNFDPVVVHRTVSELFGAWSPRPPPPPVPVPAMQPAAGPIWIAHADPEASLVRITYAFAATSPRMSSRGVRAVVAEMVDNRLAQVRTRLGASYGIETSYGMTDAGDLIEVDGKVDADRAGEVVRQMQADLESLRAGDDTLAADFVRARRAALARALADPVESSTAADRLEAAVGNQLAIDTAQTLPAEIAKVTLTQAREVIAQDLKPERMIVLLSGRPADTAAALAAAGVTTFQTVTDDPEKP